MTNEPRVRPATPEDLPGVMLLIGDRIGEEDAEEARLVLEDPAYDPKRWSVAADGDRVVSTMATFPMTVRVGTVIVPGAQIEFVATDADYEGRGLVRRQFAYHHADLAARGELVELMVGITYFYRRLGYEYALPVDQWRTVLEIPAAPDGVVVREATVADRAAIERLEEHSVQAVDVAARFESWLWELVLRSPVYRTLIAERDGVAVSCCRMYDDAGSPYVLDLAATDRRGVDALVARLGGEFPGVPIAILDRPALRAVAGDLGATEPSGDAYYARIGDPVGFMNAIAPELSRRLGTSDLDESAADGLLSMYSSSIAFSYGDGAVGPFRREGRVPAPISAGGSGVPPDLMTTLLLGPLGFRRLAELNPDVNGGAQQHLMEALFPPLTTDVQSWVVP